MKFFKLSGSSSGLRRVLCVMLAMGLIVGSFTSMVSADEVDGSPWGQTQNDDSEINDDEKDKDEENDIDSDDKENNNDSLNTEISDDQDVDDSTDDTDTNADTLNSSPSFRSAPLRSSAPATKKVLIWQIDTTNDDASWEVNQNTKLKNYFVGLGAEVEVFTADAITAADLTGIDLVYFPCMFIKPTSDVGQSIIGCADVLKTYVSNGGKVVFNNELSNDSSSYAGPGGIVLSQLGAGMGFDFTISGNMEKPVTFNPDVPQLTENLEDTGFDGTNCYGTISTSDTGAQWVAKNVDGEYTMVVKYYGTGFVFILADYNYLDKSADGAETFLKNLLYSGETSTHNHAFTYEADGAVITATCTSDCTLENMPSITLSAPTLEYEGEEGSEVATVSDLETFNTITGLSVSASDIVYVGTGDTEYNENTTAPTAAGTYEASLTVGNATASVSYEIKPIVYTFIEGATREWTQDPNSTIALAFRATRNVSDDKTVSKLSKVLVDGKEVSESDRNIKSGSVIVEILPAFLNNLTVGDHQLTLEFVDGDAITTTFKIKVVGSPATGEYAGTSVLILATMLLAVSGVAGFRALKKKEN